MPVILPMDELPEFYLPEANLLLLADAPATAARWRATLESPGCRVWTRAEAVPPSVSPEVVVTNRDSSPVAHRSMLGGTRADQASDLDDAPPGLIRVGVRGPADVCLPSDVSGRELQLACRLLAEIVRLRRNESTRSRAERRLMHEVLTDPLTGLPNRRAWDERLPRWLDTPNPSGRLCLALFDLDHFKKINDRLGYQAGDQVLRAASRVIRAELRQHDFVARLGGDEFGLLLVVPNEATAAAVLDRVRGALPDGVKSAGAAPVTASAGFHLAPPPTATGSALSPAALFDPADAALRQAKREGRNRTLPAPPA